MFINEKKDNLIFQDYILFIIIFLCTYFNWGTWSTFTSFIPLLNRMGSPFLCFFLSSYLFVYSVSRRYEVRLRVLYYSVLIASVWTFVKLFQTIQISGFEEAITVYRRNYIVLPSFLMCMAYISGMSIQRMEIFGQLILKWIIPLSILYVLQCCGVHLFTDNLSFQTSGGVTVLRNILGMPPILPVVLAFCFISYLKDRSKNYWIYVLIALGVTFISFTRSLIASAGFIVVLTLFLQTWKYGLQKRLFKLAFYIFLAAILLMIVYPSAFSFWENLLDDTINSQLTNDQGTYAFRKRLVEKVMLNLEQHNALMTGLGYIRDAAKGKYSFVLGGDTYIAPVLWCEGFIGLTLRCIPFLYLLFRGFSMFRKPYDDKEVVVSMVIIVTILSEIPNYVQTSFFMHYNYVMAMLYMLYVYVLKRRSEYYE